MRVYIETYGCTANKSDESIAIGILKKNNHIIVDKIDEADTLVLLTCTVIGTTEQRMLSRLRVFKKTGKKIIVAGCMPSIQKDLIKSIVPDAYLLPTSDIVKIDKITKDKISSKKFDEKKNITKHFENFSAPISIAKGCMFSCSYCITHFARGKLKSYPQNEIIKDVKQALKCGCKEIFLTAQDTASYGLDSDDNLGYLLKKVCTINGDFRIRVGMMNPFTLQKNIEPILDGYSHKKIYKFLHIPVQSGDDNILHNMNRKYTSEDFENIVSTFQKKYPNITISTDIIVGFPGESEYQFKKSIQLIKKIKPDIVNITKFSARPFTKAKTMENRIPTEIVKNRSVSLTKICEDISNKINSKHVGKKYIVLITKKEKNMYVGRAENYKPVLLKEKVNIGDFVKTQIINFEDVYLVGKLI